MAASSSKGNDFGAFLGAFNNSRKSSFDISGITGPGGSVLSSPAADVGRAGSRSLPAFLPEAPTPAPQAAPTNNLLGILLSKEGPISIGELADGTTLPFEELARALEVLKSTSMVRITADGSRQLVELTDVGRELAQLVR
jgi:predicted transcriptional regulator